MYIINSTYSVMKKCLTYSSDEAPIISCVALLKTDHRNAIDGCDGWLDQAMSSGGLMLAWCASY
jgi:hypothetical protein